MKETILGSGGYDLPRPDTAVTWSRTPEAAGHASAHIIMGLHPFIKYPTYSMDRKYPDIFIAITDSLSTDFPALAPLQRQFYLPQDTEEAYELSRPLAGKIFTDQPFSGTTILEIGGPFGQVLHGLGAETWCIDPDILGESEWWGESWLHEPTLRPDAYHPIPARLTAETWPDIVPPATFDVTFSNHVLSEYSGTSSDWRWKLKRAHDLRYDWRGYSQAQKIAYEENKAAEESARQDLFRIAAAATRPGGTVIHGGDAIDELLPLADEVHLRLVERRSSSMPEIGVEPVYIFRKD